MTQLYKLKSSVPTETDNLFYGILIRWRAMTVAERFVCGTIVLVPVWWVIGIYNYMPLLLVLGVAVYEWWQYRELRLKRPMLPVVALLVFGTYQIVRIFFCYYVPGRINFSDVVIVSFCPAFLLWYIHSNKIRIRMEVVAWACTVSAVQMIGFWLLLQFVLPETIFWPPRLPTLLALLKGKGVEGGDNNYFLSPYIPRTIVKGINRFSLFFLFPEFFAVVVGFIGLVALEIKNRFWSWLLFLTCVFLLFLSATRIVWVVFPIVVGLRYLFSTFGKPRTRPIVFALIAVVSFATLALPPATDLILDKVTHSVESVNEVREDSSEVRFEIYRQTWKDIQDDPLWGYMAKGEPINAVSNSRVGSHSVILGSLLYRTGLVGTLIFVFFWISLFIWFYETRAGRPLICFCVLIFYTLVSPTLALVYDMPISSLFVVLCAAIRQPKLKFVQGIRHA